MWTGLEKGGKLKQKSALVWKKKIALEIKRRKTECKAYDLKRRLEAFQKNPFKTRYISITVACYYVVNFQNIVDIMNSIKNSF